MLRALFESFGCRKSWHRMHQWEWSFGPDAVTQSNGLVTKQGGGWWIYCRRCGKGVWR